MRSSFVVLALASLAAAQNPTSGFDVLTSPPDQAKYSVGDTLPITWTNSLTSGTVTLELIGGASFSSLNPVVPIASSIQSSLQTFSWTIPDTVGSFASYGVNLTSDASPSTFQYSFQFYITPSANETTTTIKSTTSSTAIITVPASSTSVVASTSATPTAILSGSAGSNKTSTSPTSSSNLTVTGSTPSPTVGKNGAGRIVSGSMAVLGGVLIAFVL